MCVPLVGGSPEGIKKELDSFLSGSFSGQDVELVEFRADFFNALDNLEALKKQLLEIREALQEQALIFTIRTEREGGNKLSFTAPDYYEINRFVIENRLTDLIDLEYFSEDRERIKELIRLAGENRVKVILSNHDFEKTPESEELLKRLQGMQDLGADIAKIAVMPNSKLDVVRLMELTTHATEALLEIPVVTMAMGELGTVSRITGGVTGSAVTFASLSSASAPGQLPVRELLDAMKMMDELLR